MSLCCPHCDSKQNSLTSLYHHIKKIHGSDKWIQFRTHVIPGVHQHQCPKCHFAFDNEEKAKEDEHECDIFLQLYQNMKKNKAKRPQSKPETFSKPKENSKESPKAISPPSGTPKTPEKAPEVANEEPENDDSNEIMVINLRQGYSLEIIIILVLKIPICSLEFILKSGNNPDISDNDDHQEDTETLPDGEPESQDKIEISTPATTAATPKSNFLPIAPAPPQLFGSPNPKLPITSSSQPVSVIPASLPSQTSPMFTPTFGYPQQQIMRPFSQPPQNHYVEVPVGALVSVSTLITGPDGQATIIPQPIQPVGSQISGQMIYSQSPMTSNLQMSSVVSSSPSIRALTESETETLDGKIATKQVKTKVIQSSTPAKQLPGVIVKEPLSIEPSSSETTINIAEKSLEEKTTFQMNIEPNSTELVPDSNQFEVTEILSQANSEVSSQPTQNSTKNQSVLESIESIEIPDSPPPPQEAAAALTEPVIERHPSIDESQTGQMEIEGLDLNLAGNEEESTQIDDPIPVSDSDDETSESCEPLNNSNSSSNVTSGLKLEPIELGETPLAIVPIIESQSCLALEPPTEEENHQVAAPLPKKIPRTNKHTIVEPSKDSFFFS